MNGGDLEDLDPRTADAAIKAGTLIESLPWLKRFPARSSS